MRITGRSYSMMAAILLAGASSCPGQTNGRVVVDLPRNEPNQESIWSGSSGGFTITWSNDDLRIRGGKSSGAPFSYAAGVRDSWALGEEDLEGMAPCEYSTTLTLLSVVGSIISVERFDYMDCPDAAHPGGTTWYEAFDASNPGTKLKLTDYFPARDILAALLNDGLVKKALAGLGGKTPGTLDELITRLSGSGPCEYMFSDDLLERFAFHHLEGGRVAVRIGLSHNAEVCRTMLTQIGILLPLPPSLAVPLKEAERRRAGYLMGDLKGIAGGGVMRITGGNSAAR